MWVYFFFFLDRTKYFELQSDTFHMSCNLVLAKDYIWLYQKVKDHIAIFSTKKCALCDLTYRVPLSHKSLPFDLFITKQDGRRWSSFASPVHNVAYQFEFKILDVTLQIPKLRFGARANPHSLHLPISLLGHPNQSTNPGGCHTNSFTLNPIHHSHSHTRCSIPQSHTLSAFWVPEVRRPCHKELHFSLCLSPLSLQVWCFFPFFFFGWRKMLSWVFVWSFSLSFWILMLYLTVCRKPEDLKIIMEDCSRTGFHDLNLASRKAEEAG